MQTNNKSGSSTAAATAQPADCPPCDIPAFCRSYFYTGKLLTEGDLNREQRYAIDKLRLHYVALHGWGVACGLMVRPHPQCPDRFIVTPGFAVDDCGREIRLLKDCVIEFPKPPEPIRDPCPPDPCDDDEEKDDDERTPRPRRPKGKTYYVCIRYCECQEDVMPVVFDDCCGTSNKPNRICECAEVQILEEPPECLKEIERPHYEREEDYRERREGEDYNRERQRGEADCFKLREHIPETCPPTGRVCCIPLAVIREYVYCERFTEAMIDNSIRRVMPSAERLEELIRCVMDHLPRPAPKLTRIVRFKWDHDREYGPGEFLREFIGSHESPHGFEIEFDGRVHPKCLNNRTFQAMIVRETPETHDPRHVEVAPARVLRSEDGRRCTLHIDHEYARHHLHDHNFDVFITLRCDKVIDERGLPVDGDLLAMLAHNEDRDPVLKYPTGDGVPGGLFESWIRVRRER